MSRITVYTTYVPETFWENAKIRMALHPCDIRSNDPNDRVGPSDGKRFPFRVVYRGVGSHHSPEVWDVSCLSRDSHIGTGLYDFDTTEEALEWLLAGERK